jgi:hypothetical protein
VCIVNCREAVTRPDNDVIDQLMRRRSMLKAIVDRMQNLGRWIVLRKVSSEGRERATSSRIAKAANLFSRAALADHDHRPEDEDSHHG